MFLIRKITQAKWKTNPDLSEGEISADALTVDLKTRDNSLSFWQCRTQTQSELEHSALALAAAANHLDTFDYVWLTDDELRDDGQTLRRSQGKTPVEGLVDLHVDVCRLDYVRLGKVARRIVIALEEKRFRRLTRARVRKLLVEAVRQKRVKLGDLKTSIQAEVQKSLDAGK